MLSHLVQRKANNIKLSERRHTVMKKAAVVCFIGLSFTKVSHSKSEW